MVLSPRTGTPNGSAAWQDIDVTSVTGVTEVNSAQRAQTMLMMIRVPLGALVPRDGAVLTT